MCHDLINFEIFSLLFGPLISKIAKNQNVQIDNVNVRRKDKKIPAFNMEHCFLHLEKFTCRSQCCRRTHTVVVCRYRTGGPRIGHTSSEPYNHEESVCETTCSAIVLLGLASSEKLWKACNQIKGCWEGEGS